MPKWGREIRQLTLMKHLHCMPWVQAQTGSACQQAAFPSTYSTGAGLTRLGIKCEEAYAF